MAKNCRACTSPNREEIERRLKANESVRSISRWLLEEKQESIPKSTLFDHAQQHMNQAAAFADKLLSIPKLKLALAPAPREEGLPSDTALPPLEALAHIQNKALQIVDALTDEKAGGFTPQMVSLLMGTLKEARQAAKHRHELVFGKKYVVTQSVTRPELKEASTEDLEKRRQELLQKQKESGHV